MITFVKRHPLVTFFALTYLFLILGWVLFQAQIPLGPLFSALIVVPIVGGRQGLKDWAKRIIHWRIGLQWYALTLLLPLLATGTGALLTILLGVPYTLPDFSKLPELIPEAIFIFLLTGLGEEPGFRGFAIPQLQKHFSAITATLILVVLGVIWHLPLIITGDSPAAIIPVIVGGYFVFTWLFNNTGGSVLIAMILHTAQAIVGPQIFATMFTGKDVITYTLLMAGVYGVIVAIIVMTSRNRYLIVQSDEPPASIVDQTPVRISQV